MSSSRSGTRRRALDRGFDLAVGGLAALLLAPIGLVAGLAVLAVLGRPVLFRQQRIGRDGVPFEVMKLRTMRELRGPDGHPLPDAARQTRLGRILRSLSIDEIPTLWHVLRGRMRLVGPRPLLPEYLDRYTPRQARRHEVAPGVTGWAQVNGRNEADWSSKLEMDVWYVEHRTLRLDLWILVRTVWVVVNRRGVQRSGHATSPVLEGAPDAVPTCACARHRQPTVLHVTTVDLSLVALLLPQLVAFRAAGHQVIGVSAPGPWVATLTAAGIPHVALRHATRRAAPHRDLLAFLELVRIIRRIRPDIVHTHNPKPGILGRIAARLCGVPLVVNTVHGLYATPEDGLVRRTLVWTAERIAAACSDVELVQNEEDIPVLRRLGIPAARLQLLGNGIDLARFDPARWPEARTELRAAWGFTPDTVVIGFVGRFVAEKGLPELLTAFERLRAGRAGGDGSAPAAPVGLVLVGGTDPARPDALTATDLARARSAGAVVLDWEDPIEPFYLAFDLLCLPSHREGFPRAPMEAAAMGLPVVATDIRGCRQAVEDGRTGLLVPLRDVDALEAALRRMTEDALLRSEYGRQARSLSVTRFDVAEQIARTIAVYAELGRAACGAPRRTAHA